MQSAAEPPQLPDGGNNDHDDHEEAPSFDAASYDHDDHKETASHDAASYDHWVDSDFARRDRVCFRPHWVGLLDFFEEAAI